MSAARRGYICRSAALLVVALSACSRSEAPATEGVPAPVQPQDTVTLGPLISGTSSWVDGRYAWTDYAYDDRGTTPAGGYPSDDTANAADLVQLQLSLDERALSIRAVLETLKDPSLPLLGVGLDLDGNPQTGAPGLPGDAWQVQGTPLGLERLLVIEQGGTRVMAWSGSEWTESPAAAPRIDTEENTIDAEIPREALGASGPRWRVVGALGLAGAASWLDGGAIHDLAHVRDTSTANWQSALQADILKGDADAALAVVKIDVADFAQRRTALAQPVPGLQETFLYRSQLKLGEGIGSGDRKYAGPYQPYAAWMPARGLPPNPPLVVFLHAAMSNHLAGPQGGSQLVLGPLELVSFEMSPAAVMVTPLGRGEVFGWYVGAAEQDVLDVLADAQQRFGTDPNRAVLGGYSLGGVGTFVLAQLRPDLWAGAIDIVGAPDLGIVELLRIAPPLPEALENLRNVPFRMGHARLDELEIIVGAIQPDLAALRLHALGYDYRYWQFYLRDHLTFPVKVLQCEFEAAIARGRVANPARVVYSQEPALLRDEPDSGLKLRHDSAYWMSGMRLRPEALARGQKGTVDITSLALPDREPLLRDIAGAGENITAARDVCGDNPAVKTNDVWTVQGQAWEGYEPETLQNGIEARLTRVATVQLDLARMNLDARQPLHVATESDGESQLRLRGNWQGRVLLQREGAATTSLQPEDGVLEVPVATGTSQITLMPLGG